VWRAKIEPGTPTRGAHRRAIVVGVQRARDARRESGRFANAQAVAGAQCTPLQASERRAHVGAATPEHRRHVDSSGHGEVRAAPESRLAEAQRGSWCDSGRLPGWQRRTVDRRLEIGTAQRNERGFFEGERRPDQRRFDRGERIVVADEQIRDAQRDAIHRAAGGNAFALVRRPAEILNRGEQPGADDPNAHAGQSRKSAAVIARKRTRSPVARSVAGWRAMSNTASGVRPIRFQPPGETSGYTPVCRPPIPTAPAGTAVRGVGRRGVAIASGKPPRYAKPGMKPTMYTR